MKSIRLAVFMVALFGFSSPLRAYEVLTHEEMSEAAAFASILAKPETLTALGLTGTIEDPKLTFPNSKGSPKFVKDLFRDGANFEDSLIILRPINHFFDPISGDALLPLIAKPSPTWALEDQGSIIFPLWQRYSFADGREYFYQALTQPTKTERDANFGLTFETLGKVIHHIQDMAQPQHVRLDEHLKLSSSDQPDWAFENGSAYEQYTNDNLGKLPPLFGLYPPVNSASDTNLLTTPRSFWHTAQGGGLGIAEFTNRNFVSAGTNFDTSRYPSPSLAQAVAHAEDANALLQSVGITPPAECPPTPAGEPLKCAMTFYRTTVNDTYRPSASGTNEKTSTSSIFDQNLVVKGLTPVSSLNRFNFDAAHEFLIPRAVGYSAGLINYFFRGKMEISLPDEGVYGIIDHFDPVSNTKDTGGFTKLKLKVKNVTPKGTGIEPMTSSGKLVAVVKFHRNNCYQSDLSGEYGSPGMDWRSCRGVNEEIVVSSEASVPSGINADPSQITFLFPTPVPINATDLILQVVYRGPLGDEPDAVVAATRDISEPTYFHNYSRGDQYIYHGYWPSLDYDRDVTMSYVDWCTGSTTTEQWGWFFPPFPTVEACNQAEGLTHKLQFSPSTQPIPGYDPATASLPMGNWYDLSREPPMSPVATLVAPVGNLTRIAVLLDAVPSNMILRVFESIDTTHQIQSFSWRTEAVVATINQRDSQTDTLTPSVQYLPGRGVYLPSSSNALLISGSANPIPLLVPIQSQISPSW